MLEGFTHCGKQINLHPVSILPAAASRSRRVNVMVPLGYRGEGVVS